MIIKNADVRKRIVALHALGLSDKQIASAVNQNVTSVFDTRKDMGVTTVRGSITPKISYPHLRPKKKGQLNHNETKQRQFKNLKSLAIVKEYAEQLGSHKNFAKIARRHNVTREYVRQVIRSSEQVGLIIDGYFYNQDLDKIIDAYSVDIIEKENED